MDPGKVIDAIWESASQLGLTSRWQFWVAVLALLILMAWHKVAPKVVTDEQGLPVDSPKAPPIDMPDGGATLDQKPKGPDDWAG